MAEPIKFLVDDTCRGLAKKLRMIGYDTIERDCASWWAALEKAKLQKRTVITLLPTLRQPPDVTIWVLTSFNTNTQVQEVLTKIPPDSPVPEPFSRCLICNQIITEIPAEEARKQVPPLVAAHQSCFFQCPDCHRIYWAGSHYHKMIAWLKRWEIPEKLGIHLNNN
jgi:uncharacterized protein with PIN domain